MVGSGAYRIKNTILYSLILLPIIIQFIYIYIYALNIPRYDDYESILAFLNTFKVVPFAQKVPLLFIPHIEHRIFFTRSLSAIYYSIFGDINFRNIIFINFFLLIALFLTIVQFIRKAIPLYWKYAAIALSLGLFDLINAENADFAMSGISNYGVILFFSLSILFYNYTDRKYIVLGAFFQVLCIYTSGNGHVGAFFIVLFTMFSKDKLKIIIATISLLFFSSIYFYHYALPPGRASTDLDRIISWMLHVVGSHFSYEYGLIAGVLLLILFFSLLPVTKELVIKHNALPLLTLAGFVLTSQGMMSVFRGNMDIIISYSSRYLIYSHLLVAIVFSFLLMKIEYNGLKILMPIKVDGRRVNFPVVTIVSVILIMSYLKNFNDGKNQFINMNTILQENTFFNPDIIRAKAITDESCKQGIYCIDKERIKK